MAGSCSASVASHSGEAVEQFERGQELRATAAGAPFRGVVDEVLGVEFAQPFQGERWPGAVTQQTLASGAVLGLDAHRAVDRKATAMLPLSHRPGVIARQQAAAHEDAQQPPAHARLHRGDGWRIERGGGVEDNPARSGGVEQAVDDDTMKMEVGIEAGTETVNEGHRTEARRGA